MADHLKKGEVEKLCNFLLVCSKKQQEAVKKRPEGKAKKLEERFIARASAYTKTSTYGSTMDEIFENAKNHLTSCPDCLVIYRGYVEGYAHKKTKMFEGSDRYEMFKIFVRVRDVLGLL